MVVKDVGSAVVYRRCDSLPVMILIKKIGKNTFEAFFEGRCIGDVRFRWYRELEDGRYGDEHSAGDNVALTADRAYGRVNKIFVWIIESKERAHFRGVGTALMQAVIEYSYKKQCAGRVFLCAILNSHFFYYKLGMRAEHKTMNDRIESRLLQGGPYEHLSYTDLHFPQEAIDEWRRKIKERPITIYRAT